MGDFKVGDIIKGKPNLYGVTNVNMTKAKVIKVHPNNRMVIKILEYKSEGWVGQTFSVDNSANQFELIPKPVKELTPKKEVLPKKTEVNKVEITEEGFATYLVIGDVTIALAKGTPYGISKKHPEDVPSKLIGKSTALLRMIEDASKKGLVQ